MARRKEQQSQSQPRTIIDPSLYAEGQHLARVKGLIKGLESEAGPLTDGLKARLIDMVDQESKKTERFEVLGLDRGEVPVKVMFTKSDRKSLDSGKLLALGVKPETILAATVTRTVVSMTVEAGEGE